MHDTATSYGIDAAVAVNVLIITPQIPINVEHINIAFSCSMSDEFRFASTVYVCA